MTILTVIHFVGLVRWISEIRDNLFESRYYIYLYVAPSKILLFVVLAAAFTNLNVIDFFANAFDWWNDTFTVTVFDVSEATTISIDKIEVVTNVCLLFVCI